MPVPPNAYVRYLYSPQFQSRGLSGYRIMWENDSLTGPVNTSENTMASYTIPATSVNPVGGQVWLFRVWGLLSNNTAGALNHALRCKVNGATAIGTSTYSVPQGATSERLWTVEWWLRPDNDFNLNQEASFRVSGLLTPPTASDDLLNRLGYTRGNSIVEATWQQDIVLAVTSQWSGTGQQADMHGYEVLYWPTYPG